MRLGFFICVSLPSKMRYHMCNLDLFRQTVRVENFFGGHQFLCGATDTPMLDWISKPWWIPHLPTSSCNRYPRFTFGATPADLSWQPTRFLSTYLHVYKHWWGSRQTLSRMNYAGSAIFMLFNCKWKPRQRKLIKFLVLVGLQFDIECIYPRMHVK